MTIVVDASVAAQWVLEEESTPRANTLRLESGLIAPSLIAAEIGSALWKAVRRRVITSDNALAAIEVALLPFEALIATEELRIRALALAVELQHPIYDCFYIALAEREQATLITADEGMIAAARKAKIKVRRL
jgi:predicted nucleic acid-binding protein